MAEEFPTTEDHHGYDNRTIYGAAKMFNEGLLRSFHDMFGLDYVALRYFNVYGPRMDIHGVYTEVLVRWMERIAAGQPPLILGDGKQTMDFVYVDDIARANLLAADVRRHRRGVQRRVRRRDEPARSRRDAARGDGLRPRARIRPRAGLEPGSRDDSPTPQRPAMPSASRPRSTSTTGWSGSSRGGANERRVRRGPS